MSESNSLVILEGVYCSGVVLDYIMVRAVFLISLHLNQHPHDPKCSHYKLQNDYFRAVVIDWNVEIKRPLCV